MYSVKLEVLKYVLCTARGIKKAGYCDLIHHILFVTQNYQQGYLFCYGYLNTFKEITNRSFSLFTKSETILSFCKNITLSYKKISLVFTFSRIL